MSKDKVIVAISGSSGLIYGMKTLFLLKKMDIEIHLIMSEAANLIREKETSYTYEEIISLADVVYPIKAVGAAVASGSFQTRGMIIAPCSMNTLGAIANGVANNLITRAADVVLKERRKLVLMVRETPFNLIHIRNMETLTLAGGVIYPPIPSFYIKDSSLDKIIEFSVARALILLGLNYQEMPEWGKDIESLNNQEIE